MGRLDSTLWVCMCYSGKEERSTRYWKDLTTLVPQRVHWGSSDTQRREQPSLLYNNKSLKAALWTLPYSCNSRCRRKRRWRFTLHLWALSQRQRRFKYRLLIYTEIHNISMKGKATKAEKKNENKHLRCFTNRCMRKNETGDRKMRKIKEASAEKCHGGNTSPVIFSNSFMFLLTASTKKMNNLSLTKVVFIACRVLYWISLNCESVPAIVKMGECTHIQTEEGRCSAESEQIM